MFEKVVEEVAVQEPLVQSELTISLMVVPENLLFISKL